MNVISCNLFCRDICFVLIFEKGLLCNSIGCNRMDFSGLCLGHKISRKEFIERYCGGVEPGLNPNKNDKEV